MARARRCAGGVGARKIGAACNAFAEKAMERSAEARSAEAPRKGEARRAEATWRSLHAEARRAEGRGPKGRGEILGATNWRRVQCVGEQVCRKRSAEARSAEVLRKGEARRAEPTWNSVHAEARRSVGRGPKGRGEIWVWLI